MSAHRKPRLAYTIGLVGAVILILVLALVILPRKAHRIEIVDAAPRFGTAFTLTLHQLTPPTVLLNGIPQGKAPATPLLEPYVLTQSAKDYQSFLLSASKEYIDFYGMSKDLFQQSQAAKETAKLTVKIPWVAEAAFDTGTFLLVGKILSSAGNDAPPLPRKVGITLLKWLDGRWKLYPVELAPEIQSLPFTNGEALHSIQRSSKVRINNFGKMEPLK
jgi:hypothetical protein